MTGEQLGTLSAFALEFRQRLLSQEKEAAREITGFYRKARAAILKDLADLLRKIRSAEAAGIPINDEWLRQERRYRKLRDQIDTQLARFGDRAARLSEGRRGEVIIAAARDAERLLGEIDIVFDALPVQVLEDLASRISEGSPLRTLFGGLATETGELVAQELFTGIATGRGIRKTTREISKVLDGSEHRAHLIARTETLSAYRRVSIARYESAGIGNWMWLASKSARTCASCLAMDGRVFPVSVPFASHVACRCACIPVVGGLPEFEKGGDWLAKQDAETQDGILTKKGGELFRGGLVTIDDFVQDTFSPVYGPGRRQRSIAEMKRLGRVPINA